MSRGEGGGRRRRVGVLGGEGGGRRSRITVLLSCPSSLSSPAAVPPVLVRSSHAERARGWQEWWYCRGRWVQSKLFPGTAQGSFSPLSGGWMEARTLDCPGRPAAMLAFSAASKVAREG